MANPRVLHFDAEGGAVRVRAEAVGVTWRAAASGSAGAGGAPCAAAGDSPVAAGGGDTRVRQPPTGLPAAGGGAAAWCPPQPALWPQPPTGSVLSQLTDTVRLAYGVDGPAPDWLPLVQTYGPALWGMSASQLVDLLGTPHAMYAVVDSNAFDSVYSSVASLGASLAEVPVASVGTCVDTSPGAAPEDASLSFTLDSGASHCFFRDCTTLTPLPKPVSVALADPTPGPVTARYTTTLPCLAVPSGSLTGFHVPSFSRNLVGMRPLVSQHVGVWIEPSGETAVCVDGDTAAAVAAAAIVAAAAAGATAHDPCHCPSSGSRVSPGCRVSPGSCVWSASCLRPPRVLPSLPPSLAPPCSPYVEGRLHATPHSSSLRLATEPFETLHLDVWGPASRPGPKRESFFLVVVDDYSRYTTVFPLAKKSDVTRSCLALFPACSLVSLRTRLTTPFTTLPFTGSLTLVTSVSTSPSPSVSHATPPPSVAPQVQPPSPQSSSQPTSDPTGAGFRGEDPEGASSRGVGVGAESVPVRGPGSGGAGVGAEPVIAGDSSLQGAGVSGAGVGGAVLGSATTEGAPSTGHGEPGTDPVTSGGPVSLGPTTTYLPTYLPTCALGRLVL
ncbi:unnamed protein product [Closterium sp. NIES-53]